MNKKHGENKKTEQCVQPEKIKTSLGLILAGGRSLRMGQDKVLLPFGNSTLFEYILARFKQQIDEIIISTSSNYPVFSNCGHDLIRDIAPFEGFGPLSGLYAAFDYCQKKTYSHSYDGIITVAVDTPFFPNDYVYRLNTQITPRAPTALIAATKQRLHPTFAFWPIELVDALHQHLLTNQYSILSFIKKIVTKPITFPVKAPLDPFFNINTRQELELARNHLTMLKTPL